MYAELWEHLNSCTSVFVSHCSYSATSADGGDLSLLPLEFLFPFSIVLQTTVTETRAETEQIMLELELIDDEQLCIKIKTPGCVVAKSAMFVSFSLPSTFCLLCAEELSSETQTQTQ